MLSAWGYVAGFALAVLVSAAVCGLLIPVAFRWRLVDRPGIRKTHRRAVAYLGGLGVLSGAGIAFAMLFRWLDLDARLGERLATLAACTLPALGGLGLGLWDDVADLRPRYKFLIQASIAFAFSLFAYRLHALHLPGFMPWPLDPVLGTLGTAFFMLALVNGFNMIDGSDGLCTGVSAASLAMVAVAAAGLEQPLVCLLALVSSGACLGFLFWNRAPARMYLGDAGSQGLGFLVSALLLALGNGLPGQDRSAPWQPFHYHLLILTMLAGFPALEVTLTVLRRGLQGRSLGRGDQGHLHHRLQRLGLRPSRITLVAVAVNTLGGCMALAFLAAEKGLVVLLALPMVVLLVLGLQQLGYTRIFKRRWVEERRPHYAIASHFGAMQAAKLTLVRDREEVLDLVGQACVELGAHECRITVMDPRSEGGRWKWTWAAPRGASEHPGRADHVRLAAIRAHASWILELDEREPELDMNLRVIMGEFMRQALETLHKVMQGELQLKVVTGSKTDRPGGRSMSVRGLKRRI